MFCAAIALFMLPFLKLWVNYSFFIKNCTFLWLLHKIISIISLFWWSSWRPESLNQLFASQTCEVDRKLDNSVILYSHVFDLSSAFLKKIMFLHDFKKGLLKYSRRKCYVKKKSWRAVEAACLGSRPGLVLPWTSHLILGALVSSSLNDNVLTIKWDIVWNV